MTAASLVLAVTMICGVWCAWAGDGGVAGAGGDGAGAPVGPGGVPPQVEALHLLPDAHGLRVPCPGAQSVILYYCVI